MNFLNADFLMMFRLRYTSCWCLATRVYQKIDKKQRIKMGKVLFESMSKENTKKLTAPQEKLALPVPQLNQMQAAIQNCKLTVTLKQNVTEPVIPFEAQFDQDISIPDIDLLSAMCRIEQDNTPVIMSNSVVNTSNVINQIPKALFENCHIGMINLNIIKK